MVRGAGHGGGDRTVPGQTEPPPHAAQTPPPAPPPTTHPLPHIRRRAGKLSSLDYAMISELVITHNSDIRTYFCNLRYV